MYILLNKYLYLSPRIPLLSHSKYPKATYCTYQHNLYTFGTDLQMLTLNNMPAPTGLLKWSLWFSRTVASEYKPQCCQLEPHIKISTIRLVERCIKYIKNNIFLLFLKKKHAFRISMSFSKIIFWAIKKYNMLSLVIHAEYQGSDIAENIYNNSG